MTDSHGVLAFKAEYFDPRPQIVKTYIVKYFQKTHEVEMQDLKAHRTFLKRSKLPESILASSFQVDNQVLVYGRVLKLIDYADPLTAKILGPDCEKQLVFLSPAIHGDFGAVLEKLEENNFSLIKVKTLGLVGREAQSAGEVLGVSGAQFEEGLGVSLAIMVRGAGANKIKETLGQWGGAVSCTGSEKVS